jgi:hypothetical protein
MRHRVDKNCTDEYNRCGAYLAAKHGHVDVLRLLKKARCNFNILCSEVMDELVFHACFLHFFLVLFMCILSMDVLKLPR